MVRGCLRMTDAPKRVLLVFGKLNRGGAETLAMNIYRNIDRAKLQFDFIVHTNDKCDYDQEILSLGGKIYRFPRYNVINHFEYKKQWNEFFKEHKEYKVIHAHMTGSASVFLPISKKYGLYTVSHSHIAKSQEGIRQKIIDLYRLPLKRISDYMFACSDIAGEWMFGKNISKMPNYKIIKNGIDAEKFAFSAEKREQIRKEFNLDNCFVIGNVARFHRQKNHEFLINIMREVVNIEPTSKLLLVGSGQLEEYLKKQAKELGIEENVIFTGIREDIDKILCAIDVFCMPSFREGLPVSLVEAQGSGVQIVCSNTIAKEIQITDLIHQLSLDDCALKWADEIIKYKTYNRKNRVCELVKAGYDIKSTAKWIENFYLGKSE